MFACYYYFTRIRACAKVKIALGEAAERVAFVVAGKLVWTAGVAVLIVGGEGCVAGAGGVNELDAIDEYA